MADVKMCDKCGVVYVPCTISRDAYSIPNVDLCPKCHELLQKFMTNKGTASELVDMLDTNYGIEVYYDSTLNKWRTRYKH